MSRTLPNNRTPLVYVPAHKKFIRPEPGSSDIAEYFSSTHSSDKDREVVDSQRNKRKKFRKKHQKSTKKQSHTSKERGFPSIKESSSTEKSTPSPKKERSSSTENSTPSPKKESSSTEKSTPSPKNESSSIVESAPNPKNENSSLEKSKSSPINESSSSAEKITSSAKKKITSLRKKRTASQAFPSKSILKSNRKSKLKLSILRKKRAVSSSCKEGKLGRRSSKRKISSSENEHVSKKQPKKVLGKSKSISADSQTIMHTHENISLDVAYDQPSTSKIILNKPDADMLLNENSAMSVDDRLNNGAPNFSFKESSEMIQYGKLSGEEVTAKLSGEFSENDLDINYYLSNKEKKGNKYSCRKKNSGESSDIAGAGEVDRRKENIGDSGDISAAGEVDRRKENSEDSGDISAAGEFDFRTKNISDISDMSAAGEIQEEKKKAPCVVIYAEDYCMNATLTPGEASTSSKGVSDNSSSRKNTQQRYREKLTEGENPLKLLLLREVVMEMVAVQPKTKVPENSPMKSIQEEGSHIQKSNGSCTDTSTDSPKKVEADDESPKTSENKDSGIKINPLPVRKENWWLPEGERWKNWERYREMGKRHTFEEWFKKYSKTNNKWWRRVLRYISSVIPELNYDSESENCQSGINLSTISDKDYYTDKLDNIDVAAEIIIGNTDSEEKIDVITIDSEEKKNVETIDLEEEIDVETIVFEEETDEETGEEIEEETGEEIYNKSLGSQSPKLQSLRTQTSNFHSPENEMSDFHSPENEMSDFHSPETELSESQSPKEQSPDNLFSVNKLEVRKSGENESSASQPPENESSASQPPENESSASQPPKNESSASQPPENEASCN